MNYESYIELQYNCMVSDLNSKYVNLDRIYTKKKNK